MNKNQILLFFLLVFAACDREVENICTYQITNESSKLVSTRIMLKPQGVVSLTCLPGDSTYNIQGGHWSTPFWAKAYYEGVAFYNLSDTTSFVISDFYNRLKSLFWHINEPPVPTSQDSLLFRSWIFKEVSRDDDAVHLLWKVTLTDELVNTFQKDTSMLSLFKTYYSR